MATSLSTCALLSNTRFLRPIGTHNPNGISIGSAAFVPILYNGTTLPPSKLPLPMEGSGHPSNTWFPGPTQVLNPNGILISSAFFAGLGSVTDRQTDQPCYLVGNNRPHLHT